MYREVGEGGQARVHTHTSAIRENQAYLLVAVLAHGADLRGVANRAFPVPPSGAAFVFRHAPEGSVDVRASPCPSGLAASFTGVFPAALKYSQCAASPCTGLPTNTWNTWKSEECYPTLVRPGLLLVRVRRWHCASTTSLHGPGIRSRVGL